MKHIFIPFCTILYSILSLFSCDAQVSNKTAERQLKEYRLQTKEFIEFIRDETSYGADILVDKPDMVTYGGCVDGFLVETTLFSKDEKGLIKSQIVNPMIKKWDTLLVDDVKIVNSDTIKAIFDNQNRGWQYFHENYGAEFSSYSAPIFLRDYTICLFYSGYSCGWLCGSGQVALFKKEEGVWKIVDSFCQWIS